MATSNFYMSYNNTTRKIYNYLFNGTNNYLFNNKYDNKKYYYSKNEKLESIKKSNIIKKSNNLEKRRKSSSFTSSKAIDEAIAGLGAGAITTLSLHPLDNIKTRLQVKEGQMLSVKNSGTIHTFVEVVNKEGYKGLYQGLSPNLIGNAVSWAIYFWAYSIKKDQLKKKNNGKRLSKTQNMIASSEAGLFTQICTSPFWLIKTRMCIQNSSDPNRYKNIIDAFKKIYRTEGVRGFYKGMIPTIFGTSHGAIQFVTYEEMKNIYMDKYPEKKNIDTFSYLIMAATSKILASSITYPYQVVRARLQNQRNNEYGVIDVVKTIYKREGFRGYYKGVIPGIIRVLPSTCVTFVVYETLSRLLSTSRNNNEDNEKKNLKRKDDFYYYYYYDKYLDYNSSSD